MPENDGQTPKQAGGAAATAKICLPLHLPSMHAGNGKGGLTPVSALGFMRLAEFQLPRALAQAIGTAAQQAQAVYLIPNCGITVQTQAQELNAPGGLWLLVQYPYSRLQLPFTHRDGMIYPVGGMVAAV